MNAIIQLPNEFLKHTAVSGCLYSRPISQGNTNISTSTHSGGLFFVISNVEPQQNQSKDIDSFIGELLANDQSLAMELQDARKTIADVLYEGQPESLKILRLRAGYSQSQLAEMIGMKQPNICEFETGKRKPSLETLQRLSEALGVTADNVLKALAHPE